MLCVLIATGFGRQPTPDTKASALLGVWKHVESTSADGQVNKAVQPGRAIYTDKHYALLEITDERPTPAAGQITDAEKIKLFDAIIANAGTYEFEGSTITTHAQVAKDQAVIGRALTLQIAVTGNRVTVRLNSGGSVTYERIE